MTPWHVLALCGALAAPPASDAAPEAPPEGEEASVDAPPEGPEDADAATRSVPVDGVPRNPVGSDTSAGPAPAQGSKPAPAAPPRDTDAPVVPDPAVVSDAPAPAVPAAQPLGDLLPPPTSPRPLDTDPPPPPPPPRSPPAPVPRGARSLVALVVASILAVLLSIWTVRARALLAPRGLLPDLLRVGHGALRVFAALLLALALASVTPRSWLPWLGWGTLATLGLGLFVVRDTVRDVVSGAVVAVEGRVRRGWLVHVGEEEGVVDDVTLRAAVLRGADGTRRVVPWRRFLEEDVHVEESGRPAVTVTVHVPWDGDLDLVRERVVEAALVSPWRAPGSVPEVHRGEAPGAWEVRVRLLDPRFEASHRDTVRDLVARAFALDGGATEGSVPDGGP